MATHHFAAAYLTAFFILMGVAVAGSTATATDKQTLSRIVLIPGHNTILRCRIFIV